MGDELKGPTALLTGLPRSGTTLTCELLNMVADVVALDEPMSWGQFTGQPEPAATHTSPVASRVSRMVRRLLPVPTHPPRRPAPGADAVCDNIERFCAEARRSISERGLVVSRHVDGKVLGSKVADYSTASGLRAKLAERGEIIIDRPLSAGFLLAVKHNSAFAALLRPLLRRFPVYAVIRNPLSILSSWQTVPFPPQEGRLEMGEAFDSTLAAELAGIGDRLDRQLHLLEWFFGRFHEQLPRSSVIRYEDIVSSSGKALSVICDGASSLDVPLENRNKNRAVYDKDVARLLGARLLDDPGSWRNFYSQESIEELLAV